MMTIYVSIKALGIEPRASDILDKYSTTELYSQCAFIPMIKSEMRLQAPAGLKLGNPPVSASTRPRWLEGVLM